MSAENQLAVECENLGRVYVSRDIRRRKRESVALVDLSLEVPQGIVFGLLGPNGAGKTTTVRILSTLLTPTTGSARVLGFDVDRQAREVRPHIGLILGGDRGYYHRLTAKENLRYFAALNRMNPGEASRRADELLDLVSLGPDKDRKVEEYSRGMKQRLHVARGLITDPSVVFMDEPTIGLDPFGAQEVRRMIPRLVEQGKTVLLTTHYMFEADQLCDSIAMINKGWLVAHGTPAQIKRQFSNMTILEVMLREARDNLAEAVGGIEGVQRADIVPDGAALKLVVHVTPGAEPRDLIVESIGEASMGQITARDPTLEEAYLSILR